IANAASRLATKRIFTARVLLFLWRRWRVATRGPGEHAAAIRKLDCARIAGLRTVLRERAIDGDLVVRLQRILAPAVARQRVGRTAFALPVLQGALLVLHVQVHPDV